MKFETFKSILLSVGICECEFYLRSTNKEGFIGYTTENDKKKYCVVYDNVEFYFDKDVDILTGKVINGKPLEEVWNDLEISFIDGLNDEEYEKDLKSFLDSYKKVEEYNGKLKDKKTILECFKFTDKQF